METSRGYVSESQRQLLSLMNILKANVLIDENRRARLADFGLLTVVSDTSKLMSSTSFIQGGTCQWMSPELFDPEKFGLEDSCPTMHSDRYALGMLIYEVLSGQVPFPRHHAFTVVAKVLKGERPKRPVDGTWFTDEVWGVLERCWVGTPGDRPRIKDVLQCLNNASMSWTPPSSQTIANSPATDSFDSSTEEGTGESEISSPLQEISSHPPLKHSRGDPNEKHI